MQFYSNKTERDTIRGKKVRSISWQNNACRDILGATGLWPSLTGLGEDTYRLIAGLVVELRRRQWHAPVDLNRGRNARRFGAVLAAIQERLDEAAREVDSDSAEVSLRYRKLPLPSGGFEYEPELAVTTVTSGTEFIFGVSDAKIDFGEAGSSYRALEALRGLQRNSCSTGLVEFTDGVWDHSGYLTRETLEEEFSGK